MTHLPHSLRRGAAACAATAVGLALLTATPATAAEPPEPDWAALIAGNGGSITVDAGPEYAGYDVLVQAQPPILEQIGRGTWHIEKASLDVEGIATVANFAGPVNLYFVSPSSPGTGMELPEVSTPAAVYREGSIEFDVDPTTFTAVVDGAVPTVAAPSLEALETAIVPLVAADLSPSSYSVGEAFDLTFSDLYWAIEGDLDGGSTSTVIYSEPTVIGTSAITGGAVTTTIGAEYTTDPHTVALMDEYGRVLTSAALDGGAAAPETTPTAAPAAAAPVAHTGSRTGTKTGAHLAETGAEAGAGALLASLLLASGAGGLLVARRRRASA